MSIIYQYQIEVKERVFTPTRYTPVVIVLDPRSESHEVKWKINYGGDVTPYVGGDHVSFQSEADARKAIDNHKAAIRAQEERLKKWNKNADYIIEVP